MTQKPKGNWAELLRKLIFGVLDEILATLILAFLAWLGYQLWGIVRPLLSRPVFIVVAIVTGFVALIFATFIWRRRARLVQRDEAIAELRPRLERIVALIGVFTVYAIIFQVILSHAKEPYYVGLIIIFLVITIFIAFLIYIISGGLFLLSGILYALMFLMLIMVLIPFPPLARAIQRPFASLVSTPMVQLTHTPTATTIVTPTHTPTATPTSIPTATPYCSSDYVQNPGFETGDASPWVTSSHTEITDQHPPRNGSYIAWLGGYNNTYDELYQNVAVPPNPTYAVLTFWYYLLSEDEIPDSDHFSVYIRNSDGTSNLVTVVEMDNTNTTDDYVRFPYQLSHADLLSIAAAGGDVQLYFRVTTNGEGQTAVFVDDIVLEVCQ